MIMSAGRAPRIASASIPACPAGTAGGHGDRGRGGVRSVPGTGELPAGLDDVFQARAGLAGASPVIRRTAGAVHAGAGGAAACPQASLRAVGTKPTAIYVTSAMAANGARQSRRAVPSRAGSAGVILRG